MDTLQAHLFVMVTELLCNLNFVWLKVQVTARYTVHFCQSCIKLEHAYVLTLDCS
jgi:hypothetical protein